MFSILVFGDVFGKIGRRAIATVLPSMRERYHPTYVIANGENLAHGSGVTENTVTELLNAGVDALTGGNHTLDKKEGVDLLNDVALWKTLRPANILGDNIPGVGSLVLTHGGQKLLVISLMARAFFKDTYGNPFTALDAILAEHAGEQLNGTLVDLHSEASAEAVAFGYHAEGKVSAVVGTHTHVGTIDARVLPGGTAYVTDIGIVGAVNSVIGATKDPIVASYVTETKPKISPVEVGLCQVSAVLITIDETTGKATEIKRVDEQVLVN